MPEEVPNSTTSDSAASPSDIVAGLVNGRVADLHGVWGCGWQLAVIDSCLDLVFVYFGLLRICMVWCGGRVWVS